MSPLPPLGPRIGPRKAVLVGAVLGTAPDLDVFVPLGDPVSDFVLHRGPTHSLIVQALVTPLFAEPLNCSTDCVDSGREPTSPCISVSSPP